MSKARNLSDFISDATVDATEIADGAVTSAKLHTNLDLSSKTLTFASDQISGNQIHGGVISGFASTGIDDNASSTAVTINSSGNVELTGGGTISSNGTADTIILSGSTGVDTGGNITLHGNTHSNASQIFFKNGSTNVMTIAGGNVGIGTDNPSQKLDVAGVIKSTRADYAKIMLNSTTPNNTWIVENSGGKLAFTEENVAAHMHIATGGNVGIGTDSPARNMHVKGGTDTRIRCEESGGSFVDTTVTSTGHYIDSIGEVPLVVHKSASQDIVFKVNSQTMMQIRPEVVSSGAGGVQIEDGRRLAFNEAGVRSWTMRAESGYFRVASGDGYGKTYFNHLVSANGFAQSNSNSHAPSPQKSGYLGTQYTDGIVALYYLGQQNSTSSGSTTVNWCDFYRSGHWGHYPEAIIIAINSYYRGGFRKWHVQNNAVTLMEEYGSDLPSLSISYTQVGSGTHSGQSVWRNSLNFTTGGSYMSTLWFVGTAAGGGGGSNHYFASNTVSEVSTWASTNGACWHFHNLGYDAMKDSPFQDTI